MIRQSAMQFVQPGVSAASTADWFIECDGHGERGRCPFRSELRGSRSIAVSEAAKTGWRAVGGAWLCPVCAARGR